MRPRLVLTIDSPSTEAATALESTGLESSGSTAVALAERPDVPAEVKADAPRAPESLAEALLPAPDTPADLDEYTPGLPTESVTAPGPAPAPVAKLPAVEPAPTVARTRIEIAVQEIAVQEIAVQETVVPRIAVEEPPIARQTPVPETPIVRTRISPLVAPISPEAPPTFIYPPAPATQPAVTAISPTVTPTTPAATAAAEQAALDAEEAREQQERDEFNQFWDDMLTGSFRSAMLVLCTKVLGALAIAQYLGVPMEHQWAYGFLPYAGLSTNATTFRLVATLSTLAVASVAGLWLLLRLITRHRHSNAFTWGCYLAAPMVALMSTLEWIRRVDAMPLLHTSWFLRILFGAGALTALFIGFVPQVDAEDTEELVNADESENTDESERESAAAFADTIASSSLNQTPVAA